jgi:hypothetical protein
MKKRSRFLFPSCFQRFFVELIRPVSNTWLRIYDFDRNQKPYRTNQSVLSDERTSFWRGT